MLLAAAFFSAGIVVAIGVRSVARSDPGLVAAVPTASASAAHDDGAPPFEARFVRAAPFDVKASAWRMRVTYSLAQTREAPERAFFVAGSGVYLKASCHDGAQTETDITQVVLPPGLAVGEHATMLGEPFYYRPLNRAPSWCQLEIYSVVPSTSPTTRLQPAGEACVDTGKDPYVVTSGRCVR